MKANINWRRTTVTGLRLVLAGTSYAFAASSRLLKVSGTACEKLRAVVRSGAERLSSGR